MFKTVAAAEALLASGTRDTWALADAVLDDVPERGREALGKTSSRQQPVLTRDVDSTLEGIADELAERGITTIDGNVYTLSALRELRGTALRWPAEMRHGEAAFRTHQEARSPDTPAGGILDGLCRFARVEDVECPPDVDAGAWAEVTAKVEARIAKGARFVIVANDLRVLLGRRVNTPPKLVDVHVLGYAGNARDALRDMRAVLPQAALDDRTRTALVCTLRSMVEMIEDILAALPKVTDEMIEDFMASEALDG